MMSSCTLGTWYTQTTYPLCILQECTMTSSSLRWRNDDAIVHSWYTQTTYPLCILQECKMTSSSLRMMSSCTLGTRKQHTLFAYFKELRFSAKLIAAGLRQVIMAVRAFPPKESFSSRVILDTRYGTWEDFRFGSPRALMTLPSARSPLLMYTDSAE